MGNINMLSSQNFWFHKVDLQDLSQIPGDTPYRRETNQMMGKFFKCCFEKEHSNEFFKYTIGAVDLENINEWLKDPRNYNFNLHMLNKISNFIANPERSGAYSDIVGELTDVIKKQTELADKRRDRKVRQPKPLSPFSTKPTIKKVKQTHIRSSTPKPNPTKPTIQGSSSTFFTSPSPVPYPKLPVLYPKLENKDHGYDQTILDKFKPGRPQY